jgi:hypothetical protein
VELIFETAFEKAVVSKVATLFIDATDASAINAATSAYSTRSWPISSAHNLLSIVVIFRIEGLNLADLVIRGYGLSGALALHFQPHAPEARNPVVPI